METYPKDIQSEKRDIEKPLYRFFNEILCIRPNDEIRFRPLPNINRRFFAILEASYVQNIRDEKTTKGSPKKDVFDDDFVDSKKLLLEYASKNQFETNLAPIDYQETYKTLDRELPPLPDPIKPY